jgi:hypothetical protein
LYIFGFEPRLIFINNKIYSMRSKSDTLKLPASLISELGGHGQNFACLQGLMLTCLSHSLYKANISEWPCCS